MSSAPFPLRLVNDQASGTAVSHEPANELGLVAIAQWLYAWRRRRDELFDGPVRLFGEPAWDLLLDLFVMRGEGRDVSVTDVCIGSASPVSTAIRHIRRLELAGLVTRERDETDGRRSWLRLTEEGEVLLRRMFASVATDLSGLKFQ